MPPSRAGLDLSRRDNRTQPGVSTPGTREQIDPPSQGASNRTRSRRRPRPRKSGVTECWRIVHCPNCTRAAG